MGFLYNITKKEEEASMYAHTSRRLTHAPQTPPIGTDTYNIYGYTAIAKVVGDRKEPIHKSCTDRGIRYDRVKLSSEPGLRHAGAHTHIRCIARVGPGDVRQVT